MSNNRNLDFEDEELDDMDDGDEGGSSQRGSRSVRHRRGQRKEDYFAVSKTVPNYKEVDILRRFITERAKIRPRRQTGLSAKNQRRLAQEIKRARHLALLPFTDAHSRGS